MSLQRINLPALLRQAEHALSFRSEAHTKRLWIAMPVVDAVAALVEVVEAAEHHAQNCGNNTPGGRATHLALCDALARFDFSDERKLTDAQGAAK